MNTADTPQSVTGSVIRAMREEVGLSGRKLAPLVGVSHQHLARVEAGERPLTDELQQRISRAIADQVQA